MKFKQVCLCCFFLIRGLLSAQVVFQLEEYEDLHPDINVLAGNMFEDNNISKKLLFYEPLSRQGSILVYDIQRNILSPLPAEQMEMERAYMMSTCFWDPYTKINYMYCINVFNSRDEETRGWYSLAFSEDFLAFRLQDKYQYWAQHSPPAVQLTGTKLFTVQYEFVQTDSRTNPRGFLTAYKASFKITDTSLNKTVWELNTASDIFTNLYWVTERWYFIQNRYYFAIGEAERQNTIYNYETDETVSFESECIIGYGKGVVLTTTETEEGFIGITVWTPEKEILYRDRTFSISGIIDREHGRITWGRPSIYVSYFDYPYIYCDLGRSRGQYAPYGTLIMNLNDGKTHFTPLGYHLLGIFGTE